MNKSNYKGYQQEGMMKKRMMSLLMTGMLACGALAGCGSGSSQDDTAAQTSGAAESTGETAESTGDPAELRLILYGDSSTRRDEFFKNEFHDAVLQDLNIDLSVEFMPWGSDTNISTMLASGEKFAVEYIVNNYDWHTKGYLAPIPLEDIQEHCPDLIKMRGDNGFDCVTYNGDIYAIPFGNKAYAGGMQYFDVRGDICDELGVNPADVTTVEQLEDLFDQVHEKYPDMRIITNPDFLRYALWGVCGEGTRSTNEDATYLTYVNEETDDDTVYSFYESEGFKNLCVIMKRWAEKGYLQKDLITNPSQGEADWNSGNCFCRNGMPGCLISTTLKSADPDAYETMIKIGDQIDVKKNDYDWGLAISAADTDNVDHWLDLFNWMYKDQNHYDFCVYGVKDKDYEVADDGSINKLVNDSFIDSWFMEAIPYNHYDPSFSEETIQKYEHFDDDSQFSKLSGFTFDTTPVSAEVAMLTSIYNEKIEPMLLGYLDYDENYEEVLKELKDAGLDTYLAEFQKQFSAFYSEKNQ